MMVIGKVHKIRMMPLLNCQKTVVCPSDVLMDGLTDRQMDRTGNIILCSGLLNNSS